VLVGGGAGIEFDGLLVGNLGYFAGARLDFWGDEVVVRRGDLGVETVQAWAPSGVLGLNVRLP
jgi:hypothetical protein